MLTAAGCSGDRLEACDIRHSDCQEDIFLYLQKVRGDGWNVFTEMPPVNTITEDEFRDMLLASDGGDGEPQANPWDAALGMLGLIPRESSAAQANADVLVPDVVAFYSYGTKSVTVIDRGQSQDPAYDDEVLAHEFVHAIQDHEIGSPSYDMSVDDMFARDSYVEGEAVLYEYLVSLKMAGIPPGQIDWDGFYADMLADIREGVVESTSPFYSVQELVYALGGDRLTRLYLKGGNAAIRSAYESRSATAVAYMAGTLDGPERERQVADCPFTEPDGLEPYGYTVMGASVAYAFLTGADVEDGEAWDAALGWEDDRILVYSDDSGESVALVWCLRFEDDTAAERFIDHVPLEDYRETAQSEDQVAIAAATDDEGLAAWEPDL